GVFQDISEVKFSQTALKKAHIELKAIFNSGPIAIITTDNNGVINHFNYGAELMLGYTAKEILGFEKPEIYHLEEELLSVKNECGKLNETLKNFNVYKALTAGKAFDRREWTYRRKDGSIFPVELTLTAIKDDAGEQMGYMAVATNISERKKSEHEILKKNQLLLYAEKITMMGNWQWNVVTNV
ncbi:PAS domain S-box protein, partial [Agrococcus terreus]